MQDASSHDAVQTATGFVELLDHDRASESGLSVLAGDKQYGRWSCTGSDKDNVRPTYVTIACFSLKACLKKAFFSQ